MSSNRNGLFRSDARADDPVGDATDRRLQALRVDAARVAEPVGSVPPPTSLKGVAKALAGLIQGERASVLVDRLGERLASERTLSRVYELLLVKLEARGSWEGGPRRTDLAARRDEELSHSFAARDALRALGVDATAMTPAADLAGALLASVVQIAADPRTSLGQALSALLVAELADLQAWELVGQVAKSLGDEGLAMQLGPIGAVEEAHVRAVRTWVSTLLIGEANIDVERRVRG